MSQWTPVDHCSSQLQVHRVLNDQAAILCGWEVQVQTNIEYWTITVLVYACRSCSERNRLGRNTVTKWLVQSSEKWWPPWDGQKTEHDCTHEQFWSGVERYLAFAFVDSGMCCNLWVLLAYSWCLSQLQNAATCFTWWVWILYIYNIYIYIYFFFKDH
jgi:hypothetical protein